MTTTRVVDLTPATPGFETGSLTVVALGAFGIGLGDLLVALAGARNQSGGSGVSTLYWSGIALLYGAPTAARSSVVSIDDCTCHSPYCWSPESMSSASSPLRWVCQRQTAYRRCEACGTFRVRTIFSPLTPWSLHTHGFPVARLHS